MSKTWMATVFSISMRESRWLPPAIAILSVVAAIQRQAERLIHMSGTDFYYENMVELG